MPNMARRDAFTDLDNTDLDNTFTDLDMTDLKNATYMTDFENLMKTSYADIMKIYENFPNYLN